ncbi:catalase [Sedimentibacter hydroxybenzoicus DSM 7310]|uniref:Catalase n=1 Tax=Sedimentibacter hydroxybenzoicus DSM 7310 TaxID=1123245 RepID=A0A974BJ41_SEDHY|nr:catalase [Sedimentibacter hydroxybenzoicus]NYB73580.1 catalase [Sedimentibacter hydroxybenzoicus DSM 7310]
MNNFKDEQLNQFRVDDMGKDLTTNQGLKMTEDEFSLKAGERGPTLMEDFHFREKITHFDHERIPERVVHARGTGAHGEFQLYESMKEYTKAGFLQNPNVKTPIFIRFSTVAGFRGSADTVRDVRGFAIKFYTQEGNYDLVANNMPVFFMQDAIKFPDFIHAVKPEPRTEVPQASSAHDTFWDYIANNQESAHMVMWAMSDRAIPRSYRMMEGFGVHTFRFINEQGKATFVKFHLKPALGVHSLVWDETQKIAGKNPDFNRKDLQEAIDCGNFPEFEFGVQLLAEEDEFSLDFDILDPTKLWPEEDIPVKIIGKITLNKNVDNFFAEVEQVAFHPGHVVPGIDFTNDPLLQGRLFSYTDTQLIRLGGPNFHEIPINKPLVQFHNNQRDGYHRQTINTSNISYHRNSLANGTPKTVSESEGGYAHYQEKVSGNKIRARSDSFKDHFSQAAMFYNSMSEHEKKHIMDAFKFEVGKVKSKEVRQQVVDMFGNVNTDMANQIADSVGVNRPEGECSKYSKVSPALSQANTVKRPDTLKVGCIICEGYNSEEFNAVLNALYDAKTTPEIISSTLSPVKGSGGEEQVPKYTFTTTDPVLMDAIYVIGGPNLDDKAVTEVKRFIHETYMHYKPILVSQNISMLLDANMAAQSGVTILDGNMQINKFINDISMHRHWDRNVNIIATNKQSGNQNKTLSLK